MPLPLHYFLAGLLASAPGSAYSPPPSGTAVAISIAGAPLILWSAVDTLHKCRGIIDVPDIPARPYLLNGETHMIVGATTYHRMAGSSIFNLSRECFAAFNATKDANPANFAGDEFLDSQVAFPSNGTVYSLGHTEYPGDVYHNCSGPAYPRCWTVTIGLAVSRDGGRSWAHARPPPGHLVAAVPYGYNQSQLAYGWGDPSNIVRKGGFYYAAIWNRNQVGLQAPGVCIMRTSDITDPASWRGWGGAAFSVPFASPYTMAPGTESDHVCVVSNLPNCPVGGLAWSAFLGGFVATLDCTLQAGPQFYAAFSEDLLAWSAPQSLYQRSDLPSNVSALVTSMAYPTFLDPSEAEGDPNFGTLGEAPYLSWVSIGHSPYTDGRKLWATPMRFSRA